MRPNSQFSYLYRKRVCKLIINETASDVFQPLPRAVFDQKLPEVIMFCVGLSSAIGQKSRARAHFIQSALTCYFSQPIRSKPQTNRELACVRAVFPRLARIARFSFKSLIGSLQFCLWLAKQDNFRSGFLEISLLLHFCIFRFLNQIYELSCQYFLKKDENLACPKCINT